MIDFEPKAAQQRRSFLAHAGYLTVVFVVLANIAAGCLTEVSLSWQTLWRVSTEGLLYLASVYVVFCSMGETGRRDARNGAAYTEAREACLRWTEAARPYRRRLGGYVTRLIAEELRERRVRALEAVGLTPDDYLRLAPLSPKKRRQAGLDPAQRRAVRRARAMRPARLEISFLCEAEAPPAGRRLLVSPERMRLARYTAALGPTTLFAVLSVQVVFAVRAESDPRAVLVACLLRVGLLGWTALRGYMTGERSILTDSVRYYTVKAELLRDFVDAQRREADSRPEADRPSA